MTVDVLKERTFASNIRCLTTLRINLVEFGIIGFTFSEVMRQFYSHANDDFVPNYSEKKLVLVGK